MIAETDSGAMVNILNNNSEPSMVDNTLVANCKHLMGLFQIIKVVHIFHEDNQCANYLANMGQHSPWGTTVLELHPSGLAELLQRDALNIATSRHR